jgi:hypothetical protein
LQLYCFFCLISFKDGFEYWTRGRNSETDRDREMRPLCTTEKGASRRPFPSCSFTCGHFQESKDRKKMAIAYPRLREMNPGTRGTSVAPRRVTVGKVSSASNRRPERPNDRSLGHQEASLRLACHQASAWQPEILPSWQFNARKEPAQPKNPKRLLL